AVGILASTGQLPDDAARGFLLLGELGLDGALRPVRGALPIAIEAKARRMKVILPRENVGEAAAVGGLAVWGAGSLGEVAALLQGRARPPENAGAPAQGYTPGLTLELADVRGQEHAKRAL